MIIHQRALICCWAEPESFPGTVRLHTYLTFRYCGQLSRECILWNTPRLERSSCLNRDAFNLFSSCSSFLSLFYTHMWPTMLSDDQATITIKIHWDKTLPNNKMDLYNCFTCLMAVVDQRVRRAQSAAIMEHWQNNVHVDALFWKEMCFLFCVPVNVCMSVSALMCTS